jgi:hypothetical protein
MSLPTAFGYPGYVAPTITAWTDQNIRRTEKKNRLREAFFCGGTVVIMP